MEHDVIGVAVVLRVFLLLVRVAVGARCTTRNIIVVTPSLESSTRTQVFNQLMSNYFKLENFSVVHDYFAQLNIITSAEMLSFYYCTGYLVWFYFSKQSQFT